MAEIYTIVAARGKLLALGIALIVAAGVGLLTKVAEAAGDQTALISRTSGGAGGGAGNGDSFSPSISADGCRVAFASDASNLGGPDFSGSDVFVRDHCASTTSLVSVGSGGAAADGPSYDPAISGDGTHVAFVSQATNLEGIDSDSEADVFVRDLTTGNTQLVSVGTVLVIGTQSVGGGAPSVSGDGRYVAFESTAQAGLFGVFEDQGLLTPDSDVFVRDTDTGSNRLVSASDFSPATTGNKDSFAPSISADGSRVGFESNSTDLVPGDSNGAKDVFVADPSAQTMTLASRASTSTGAIGDGPSFDPALSANGQAVAFSSDATNLAPGSNGQRLVYARHLGLSETALASVGQDGLAPAAGADSPGISGDGARVAFVSDDQALGGAPQTASSDVFVHDFIVPFTILASRVTGAEGASGDADSSTPALAAYGESVAFASTSGNLSSSDIDPASDVFRRDISAPAGPVGGLPEEGETVNLTPRRGHVTFTEPGDQSESLERSVLVPVGTKVNARAGRAELFSEYNNSIESTDVYGGLAKVKQQKGTKPVVRFLLVGDLGGCGAGAARVSRSTATASGRRGRHLWGSGRGHYRTGGRRGAATVRGTTWLTSDRCDGSTRFYVKSSISGEGVVVNDYDNPGRKDAVLLPGQSYVAR